MSHNGDATEDDNFDCAQDALLASVERLMEAADELHDKLTDEQKRPLKRALGGCFAALYFLCGWTDGEAVAFIREQRREDGKPPLDIM